MQIDGAVEYHYGLFPPYRIDYTFFIEELLGATEALSRFDQTIKKLHNSELYLAPLRNQEAVLSNRIEGTISTIDEMLQFEAGDEGFPFTTVRSDVIETIMYQRALDEAQYALENGYTFSLSFIKTVHKQLLSYGRGASKSPGEFKKEQNYLVDTSTKKIQFIPIRPEQLNDGLERLVHFIENSSLPPLLKVALTHVEFEALHPFQDGNGRIGRMIITLLLWKYQALSQPHFYISGYFEEHKEAYIEAMRNVSKNNDWNGWIKFFLIAVQQQAIKNLEMAEVIESLYTNMKLEFTELLSSKWNVAVLDYIFTYPIFSHTKFIKATKIPSATATSIMKKLMDKGYLKQIKEPSGRRAGLYMFEPLLVLVRV